MVPGPDFSPDFLSHFVTHGRDWVVTQRQRHRPHGKTLPADLRTTLAPYFRPDTLDSVRVTLVPVIENPSFYDLPELADIPVKPPDFNASNAVTFIDTVVIADSRHPVDEGEKIDLYFHECIHVAQYRFLGLDGFIRSYLEGWAKNGYAYARIPLEQQAYRFGNRLIETWPVAFPAEDELVTELAAGEAGGEALPIR